MAVARPTTKLAPLTGLRFVAAMAVVLFHSQPAVLRGTVAGDLVVQGHMGVSAFFVLSGFILAYNYLRDDAPIDRRAFWAARVARVYPVYLLGVVAALPHFVYEMRRASPDPLPGIAGITAAAAALVQAWIPSASCRLNCPGWSLSVEAFFYLAFPVVAVALLRHPWWRLLAIVLAAWIAALAAPVLIARAYPPEQLANPDALWYNPIVRLPEFVLGIALGRVFRLRIEGRALARHRAWGWLAFAAVCLIAAIALFANGAVFGALRAGGGPALVFGVLILALACGGGLVGRVLGHPVLVLLGEASYALYILHRPIVAWWATLTRHSAALATTTTFGSVVYLTIAIGVSIAVLRWVEEPARRRLRAALVRPRRVRASEAADSPVS